MFLSLSLSPPLPLSLKAMKKCPLVRIKKNGILQLQQSRGRVGRWHPPASIPGEYPSRSCPWPQCFKISKSSKSLKAMHFSKGCFCESEHWITAWFAWASCGHKPLFSSKWDALGLLSQILVLKVGVPNVGYNTEGEEALVLIIGSHAMRGQVMVRLYLSLSFIWCGFLFLWLTLNVKGSLLES